MTQNRRIPAVLVAITLPVLLAAAVEEFRDKFDVPRQNFIASGGSTYLVLEPGYQLVLEGPEGADKQRLVITVTGETRIVDQVETRIVEERESVNDKLVEVSRNFFAIDKVSGDVYYFGEDVDMYKDGKITGHGGSWQSGKDGAKYGLFLPAKPLVGQKYYQEIAPKVAMDRAEVKSINELVKVPAGTFDRCLKVEETTPLEPDAKEYKLHAPGVGLLSDGDMKLVKYGLKGN
jgi:hypothetical protein